MPYLLRKRMHEARPDGEPPPDGSRARHCHHCGRDRVTHHAPCPSSRPSWQYAFLQIHTPSLVLLPRRSLPHPRFVCPFVARAAYLSMTPKTTEGLKAPQVALLCNTTYMAQCALFRQTFTGATLLQRTRTTSATESYTVLVAISWRARPGGIG